MQGGAAKLPAPLIWTACLMAQLWPAAPGLRMLAAGLRRPALLWLGGVSYCLYLVNLPIQKLLGLGLASIARGDPTLFTVLWLPAAALLPLGAAWWLHRRIELPALAWGRDGATRQQPARVSLS